ncbi:hypothetical protein HJ070_23075 [Vibrio parahaemolyticus]|nr:hypothetical protein [Vibrio parahaemolyticus]
MFKKLSLLLIGSLFLYGCSDIPTAVEKAKDRIFNGYYDANIYEDTSCRAGQFGSDWVVLCKRIGGPSNEGIYEIKMLSDNDYIIYAVNGSAKTHASRMGMNIDFNINSNIDIGEVKRQLG